MPKRCASPMGTLLDGDRDVSPVAAVRGDERLVVHLVDVVAGQDEDDVAGLLADHLEVDEHGVRGAAVPLGRPAARDVRLEQADAALVAVEVPRPARADVVVQRARVVLRQDEDVVDLGVDAVRQREVDDPVLARERHGGLGADGRQDRQPLTFPTGKNDGGDRLHAAMLHRPTGRSALLAGRRRLATSSQLRGAGPEWLARRDERCPAVEPRHPRRSHRVSSKQPGWAGTAGGAGHGSGRGSCAG